MDIIFCKSQEICVLGLLLTTSFNNEREQDILAAFCLHFENGFVLGTKSLAQTKLGVLDQKESRLNTQTGSSFKFSASISTKFAQRNQTFISQKYFVIFFLPHLYFLLCQLLFYNHKTAKYRNNEWREEGEEYDEIDI